MSFLFRRNKDTDDSDMPLMHPTDSALKFNGSASEEVTMPEQAEQMHEADVRRWRASGAESDTRQRQTARAISQAYNAWHTELMHKDRSGVTPQELGAVTVDLTHVHPTGSALFYSGKSTLLSSLIREEKSFERAAGQLLKLRTLVDRLKDSYGYASLGLSVGVASWEVSDVKSTSIDSSSESTDPAGADSKPVRTYSCPILVRSVAVDFLPDGDARLKLSRSISIAPEFRAALLGVGAHRQELDRLQAFADSVTDADLILPKVVELGRTYTRGYSQEAAVRLGCCVHPAESMVRDLEAMRVHIEQSGVLAALAGDERVKELTSAPLPLGNPEDRLPEVERGVGDRDVDELRIVEAVASGRSLVIDAVPSTQRLGTIVSIAADAAASGRSVLIVPAHSAGGAAIEREFYAAGVGDLVVNFWNNSDVSYRIRTGLRLDKPSIDRTHILGERKELVDTRQKISTFVNDLHRTDPEWGVSVHDLLENLAELTQGENRPQTRVRFTQENIRKIHDYGFDETESDLLRAAELGVFDGAYGESLWLTALVSSKDEVSAALSLVHALSASTVPEAVEIVHSVSENVGLLPAHTPREWFEQLEMLKGIAQSLDTFLPKIFEQSAQDMVIATAEKDWRDAQGYMMKNSERRLILRQAKDLLRPGAAPENLHEELVLVQERQELWRTYSKDGGWPILPPGFAQIEAQSEVLRDQLEQLSAFFDGTNFLSMPWQQISSSLAQMEAEEDRVDTLAERNTLFASLKALGLSVFIDDVKARNVASGNLSAEFRLACTSSVFEQLMLTSPILASLGPRDITNLLGRLRELDRAHTESLALPVSVAAISQMRTFARAHRDATLSLDAMLARGDSVSLKDAIAAYPRITQLSRPVWIMPAGLAAEFLPASAWADVCILDAAPDVSMASIAAVAMRGRQVVAVGDIRRARLAEGDDEALPHDSENFLADSQDKEYAHGNGYKENIREGDEAENVTIPSRAISAFAQVLPVLELPTNRVQLNEITAVALAECGYRGVYCPIPAAPMRQNTRLVFVDGRGMPSVGGDGAVESTSVEVAAVIDAIVDHALDYPERSLVVVAANGRHASRIKEEFNKELARSAVLAEFVQRHTLEPFIITDVTQADGVNRDHVILSVGFGKTLYGRTLHSFGVLATTQGFLGLVDAMESSRDNLTIISSLTPEDLRTIRLSAPGPQFLGRVLGAAERGFESNAAGEQATQETPLIADLAARLEMLGWQTATNYGYPGSSRIPLVAGSVDIPGTWAVAVLLDDAEYVSEQSLRRRDRHRIEAYERAGWTVFQTYSTSLFIDPAGQAQAIAYELEQIRQKALKPLGVESGAESSQLPPLALAGVKDASSVAGADAGGANVSSSAPGVSGGAVVTSSHADQDFAKPKERGPRPEVSVGLSLVAYSDDELGDVLKWIASDGVPRTEVQWREELRAELGIVSKGEQIDLVLGAVVARSGLPILPVAGHAGNEGAAVRTESTDEPVHEEPVREGLADSGSGERPVQLPDL